jgi:putative peptidoglycan lipid II flippase
MASRLLGLLRESMFVALFGASWLSDAYVIAFRIPNLLRDLFAEGALSAAFVPTFTSAFANQGQERAFQVANRVLTGVLLCTSLITLLGIIFADPITHLISGGFRGDAAGLALTALLTRVMMPILALISVSAVFMGILNSRRRYAAPAYAPALFNVTSILSGVGLYFLGARGETGILVWAAPPCRRSVSCPASSRLATGRAWTARACAPIPLWATSCAPWPPPASGWRRCR